MAELSPYTSHKTRNRFIRCLSLLAIGLVALALLLVWAFFPITNPFTSLIAPQPLPTEGPESSGPSVPFPTMLALAQQEAHKIDKDAELSSVTGTSTGYTFGVPYSSPITGSLEFVFTFFRPAGNSINIWMEDAAPASTLDANASDYKSGTGQALYELAKEQRQERERLYMSMKLTPRDAVERTWEESRRYATERGLRAEQFLPLVYADHLDGIPGKWAVQYRLKDPQASPSLSGVLAGGKEPMLEFKVDGQHGQIVERNPDKSQVTPTAVP